MFLSNNLRSGKCNWYLEIILIIVCFKRVQSLNQASRGRAKRSTSLILHSWGKFLPWLKYSFKFILCWTLLYRFHLENNSCSWITHIVGPQVCWNTCFTIAVSILGGGCLTWKFVNNFLEFEAPKWLIQNQLIDLIWLGMWLSN
jgi:hypothetical protein